MIDFQNPEYFTHVLNNKGKLLEVPLRRGREDGAFIDYLTFSFDKSTLHERMRDHLLLVKKPEDEVYIHFLSEWLTEIFGFGISEKRQGKGKFFYQAFYQLGSMEVNYGTVHIGGQRNTILVDLSGVGCQAALLGWEERLYKFALLAERFSISRIDVATDFFNGEYSPFQALSDYKKGKFDVKGMRPKYKLEGTDWFNDDHSGKTLYIGRRGSSKFCRVYEKGKQLGDETSEWTRFEIEFRKNDCLIPLDILIKSGQFLSGAYPIGEKLFTAKAERILASNQKSETTLNEKIHYGRKQVGKIVRYLYDIGWDFEKIVQSLIGEEGKYPNGLKPLEYDCKAKKVEYVHEKPMHRFDEFNYVLILKHLKFLLIEREVDKSVLNELDEDIEGLEFHQLLNKDKSYMLREVDEIFDKYQHFLNIKGN